MITLDDLSLNRSLHEREAWCVDNLEFNKDKIIVSGWAFPKNGDWRSVEFFLNDQVVDFQYNLYRDDLTDVFPFCSSANQTGFSITIDKNDIRHSAVLSACLEIPTILLQNTRIIIFRLIKSFTATYQMKN